jgi:magnesium-transporting ATPase (P-type)
MKLTPTQLEYIQEAILKVNGIKYQDFYEEIYDHFIVSIETRMAGGQAFEAAFEEVYGSFLALEYDYATRNAFGRVMQVTTYYGLPALEMQYLDTLQEQSRKRHLQILKRLFGWPTLVGTVLLAAACYLLAQWLVLHEPIIYRLGLTFLLVLLPLLLVAGVGLYRLGAYLLKRRERVQSAKVEALLGGPVYFIFFFSQTLLFNAESFSRVFFEQEIWANLPVAVWACLYFWYALFAISFFQLYRERFKFGLFRGTPKEK